MMYQPKQMLVMIVEIQRMMANGYDQTQWHKFDLVIESLYLSSNSKSRISI